MMTTDDVLTLKVWETEKKFWAYAIYTNEGTEPGSLRAGAGAFNDPISCIAAGSVDLLREMEIRSCEHDWTGIFGSGVPQCTKCGIVNWNE